MWRLPYRDVCRPGTAFLADDVGRNNGSKACRAPAPLQDGGAAGVVSDQIAVRIRGQVAIRWPVADPSESAGAPPTRTLPPVVQVAPARLSGAEAGNCAHCYIGKQKVRCYGFLLVRANYIGGAAHWARGIAQAVTAGTLQVTESPAGRRVSLGGPCMRPAAGLRRAAHHRRPAAGLAASQGAWGPADPVTVTVTRGFRAPGPGPSVRWRQRPGPPLARRSRLLRRRHQKKVDGGPGLKGEQFVKVCSSTAAVTVTVLAATSETAPPAAAALGRRGWT